jgi:hypothetical protein
MVSACRAGADRCAARHEATVVPAGAALRNVKVNAPVAPPSDGRVSQWRARPAASAMTCSSPLSSLTAT